VIKLNLFNLIEHYQFEISVEQSFINHFSFTNHYRGNRHSRWSDLTSKCEGVALRIFFHRSKVHTQGYLKPLFKKINPQKFSEFLADFLIFADFLKIFTLV